MKDEEGWEEAGGREQGQLRRMGVEGGMEGWEGRGRGLPRGRQWEWRRKQRELDEEKRERTENGDCH